MSTVDEIFETIIGLSDGERAELLDRLSAHVESSTIFSAAWRSEIKRRTEAAKSGAVGTTPWEEVRAQLPGE